MPLSRSESQISRSFLDCRKARCSLEDEGLDPRSQTQNASRGGRSGLGWIDAVPNRQDCPDRFLASLYGNAC